MSERSVVVPVVGRVEAERFAAELRDLGVRHTYAAVTSSAVLSACISSMIGYLSRETIPARTLLIWIALTWLVATLRITTAYQFGKRARSGDEVRYWYAALVVNQGLGAVLLGIEPFLSSGKPETYPITVLSISVTGMLSAGAASHMGAPWAYVAGAVGVLTPLIYFFFQSGEVWLQMLGLTTVTYILVIALIATRNYRALRESHALRFENLALATHLAERSESERRARQAAEEAVLEKARFLAAASHDLRQPVHALSLFLDALEHEEALEKRRVIFEKTRQALAAAQTQLDGLLDVSRLDVAGTVPLPRAFELKKLGDHLRGLFEEDAVSRGLRLKIRLASGHLYSDATLLAQLLQNLIANALKFTSRGGVLVCSRRRPGRIVLQVWDTGIGIPDAQQADIFKEFFQVDNPERSRERGVGLGLSIVLRIAALLGTSVRVRSRFGRGSCFEFDVPVANESLEVPEKTPSVSELSGPQGSSLKRARPLVLIVDDDALAREALTLIVEGWSYEVYAVGSLASLATIGLGRVQLAAVVSDFRLPEGKNAQDVIDVVTAAQGREIPTIVVTGERDIEAVARSLSRPVPVLRKPLVIETLRSGLERACSSPNVTP